MPTPDEAYLGPARRRLLTFLMSILVYSVMYKIVLKMYTYCTFVIYLLYIYLGPAHRPLFTFIMSIFEYSVV